MEFYHADVFTSRVLSGNGLTVVFHEEELKAQYMQKIAQEFKQFETIFLKKTGEKTFRARIFTVEEELDFAGHPILGAVASMHDKLYAEESNIAVEIKLNKKMLHATSKKQGDHYEATMDQGIPVFMGNVDEKLQNTYLKALNLTKENLHPKLPMAVVSTGLPYLIVPLTSGLDKAKISACNFEQLLNKVQAKFVYVFDVERMEGRTWDNAGAVEDVATGSAAGPTGAYLCKQHSLKAGQEIVIHQGSFLGRPSEIKVYMDPETDGIKVAGDVKILAKGELFL